MYFLPVYGSQNKANKERQQWCQCYADPLQAGAANEAKCFFVTASATANAVIPKRAGSNRRKQKCFCDSDSGI